MALKTTKVRAGSWGCAHGVTKWCEIQFGAGGVQSDRRWFYRLLAGEFKTVLIDGVDYRMRVTPAYTAVYFRDPADAVWFTLKFGADHGHV